MTQNLSMDDFLKNHILTNLKIHPNGKFGLYLDNTLNYERNRYEKQIWLLDLSTYESKQLQLGIVPDDYYFHGEHVLLKVSAEGYTKFYSYYDREDELSAVCEIPFSVGQVGCGKKLYFTAPIPSGDTHDGTLCSEASPFYEEGKGVVGDVRTGLFEADYSGKAIRLLTDIDMNLNLVDFDVDNDRIVFSAFEMEKQKQKPVDSYVYTYDIDSGQLRRLTKEKFRIDGLRSMNLETIFFAGVDLEQSHRNDNQQIHKVDLNTGQVTRHGEFIDLSNERPGIFTDSVFSKGSAEQKYGNAYYHLRVSEDKQLLCCVDVSGNTVMLDTGLKTISNFWVLENEIILLGLKDLNLLELYRYSQGELTKITRHNSWLNDYELSQPKPLSVDVDGATIKGWIYSPVSGKGQPGDAVKKHPGVLLIHGGPKMIYSDVFMFDVQMLCAKGYYVFYANPMGSDGRGDAFADIRGSFGDLPHKQLMSFVDKAIESTPGLDPERLGVTGGSYGGYMTNHIITQTDRFKAAVSERGISSMMTALSSSDIGYKFAVEYAACGHDPWGNLDAFIDISPIMNVKHVKTPTLFNHGKDDFRCHYTESLNMYSALSQLGVDSRLCLYEGENHGLVTSGRPQSKRKRYEELSSWFDRYLKRG